MSATTDFLGGQMPFGTPTPDAPEEQNTPAARVVAKPKDPVPQGSQTGWGQGRFDTQRISAPAADSPDGQNANEAQRATVAGGHAPQASATLGPKSKEMTPKLADPLLALLADTLDDLERTRIASENRLRQLTRDTPDEDGVIRGLGLPDDQPEVLRAKAIAVGLAELEHQAELSLKRQLRAHPLGPWILATIGIGQKQGARLLAAIGDPYWNTLHDRPRTVSELWAYAGYRVINLSAGGHCSDDAQITAAASRGRTGTVGQGVDDIQPEPTGGAPNRPSDADHGSGEAHIGFVGVAQTRARGQRSNWSPTAKMRAFLVAESCIKKAQSPYRPVYDEARIKYADALHQIACKRCGPAGRPAAAGTPLSAGHQHARALRAVAKEVLRDLWIQARAIHLAADE